ncbi:beta-lactamase domain protein [Desulfatibacillum aliphaticivorans]|uniref:Beta-lactamase domain protein n=1 Tax=Desulfatibacillum aliphaticivorans TaxID=218208 RepID=B8FC51_DESAL|nr:FprA family A-type flavoprotein [Desulfatibacillum aliphaticivorans]ACL05256.1 beta-lactamase domain protein [Desulfatibacillum aliphaticivorans]
MKPRLIKEGIFWMGSLDWDRRLFDALIPLPDGTTYNAYLVQGQDKTVLFDTVDIPLVSEILDQLQDVERIDYVVSHHAEPDHSGGVPAILEKYPDAKAICTEKCKAMLIDRFEIPEGRFQTVVDGETMDLGGRTLEFLHTPWVHWPETMVTYMKEDGILFSCDLFGSHIASTDLFVRDKARVYEAAKRYYAEIMMPFAKLIAKHLERLAPYDIRLIAPSHGSLYDEPAFILDAYREWVSGKPHNLVVIPYVSMHGSTRMMVECLTDELVQRGVGVMRFDLSEVDIGKLAMALVDAATVVIATPTVLTGPHPKALYAAALANLIRPKAKYASIIGSYGWGTKVVDQVAAALPNLKVEILPPVLGKGIPKMEEKKALSEMADQIAERHQEL